MGKQCCHTPLDEDEVKKILISNGLNRTKVKIKVLLEIAKSGKPLSVAEIHDKFDGSCDVSTIFRTLTQFKEKELVQEVNLNEGFVRFERVESGTHRQQHHHHHHVRCRECGDIRLIEKCDLGPFERAIAQLGFQSMEHHLEFTGICSKCAKS